MAGFVGRLAVDVVPVPGEDGLVQGRYEALVDDQLAIEVILGEDGVVFGGGAESPESSAGIFRMDETQVDNEGGSLREAEISGMIGEILPDALGVDVNGSQEQGVQQQGGQ